MHTQSILLTNSSDSCAKPYQNTRPLYLPLFISPPQEIIKKPTGQLTFPVPAVTGCDWRWDIVKAIVLVKQSGMEKGDNTGSPKINWIFNQHENLKEFVKLLRCWLFPYALTNETLSKQYSVACQDVCDACRGAERGTTLHRESLDWFLLGKSARNVEVHWH